MTKKNFKRRLPILLMALVFAATSAMATDITGVSGNNGVFNIDPIGAVDHGGQSIGYRTYDNFNLTQGDTANLKFDSGISSFVNMVNNRIDINGVLNTTKNGNYHDGNAIFVSPNGMVVGSQGILNVGSLSVYTPTAPGMHMLKKGFESGTLTTTYQGKQIDLMEAIGWHGNAPIEINGQIYSHGDVNMVANQFKLGSTGNIAAGANEISADLFDALVNTNKSSNINIRSYDRQNNGKIEISGKIFNAGNGDIKIQNRGSQGFSVAGDNAKIINSNGEMHLVNSKGTMNLGGEVTNKGGFAHITTGADSGVLNLTGRVNSEGLKILTQSASGANIGGKLVNAEKGIAITNKAGTLTLSSDILNVDQDANISNTSTADKLIVNSNIDASGKLQISNAGAGGMEINGDIKNSKNTAITNHNGAMVVNSKIENTAGKMNLTQKGNGGLHLAEDSVIKGAGDEVLIQNVGEGGLTADGTIESSAPLYLQSTKGAMAVNGSVTGDGALVYIGNTGDGGLTIGNTARISNNNKIQIMGNGAGGMNINGVVSNTDGGTSVANYQGNMTVNGSVTSKNGKINLTNKGNGALVIADTGNVTSESGQLLIQNSGTEGLTADGTIEAAAPIFLQNTKGAMAVNGSVTGDGNLVYIGNTGEGGLTIGNTAKISNNNKIEIMGNGAGGMNINGIVSNNGGGTAVANYQGNMTVNGSVTSKKGNINLTNKGNGALIIADTGNVGSEKGQLVVQNSGANGLTVNGSIDNKGYTVMYNKGGDLNIGGDVKVTGARLSVHNTGDGALKVNDSASVLGEGLGRIYLTNTGKGGMSVDAPVVSGGHVLLTNRAGGMNVSSNVTSTKNNVVLTNTGDKDMVVSGTVRGSKVTASAKGNDIVLGNTETNQIAINGQKKVFITTDNGSILNAGVDTHLIKSGGNLYMAANNGSIGEDVEGTSAIGADSRDLTKSVNVYVNGRVKAFTTDKDKNSVINIASKGKDLKVDRIKADGKVLLLTDKAVDDEGNVKTGSILNAATELGDYANVKGTTVQLMSSGSIGTEAAPIHFRQTDASKQSNVLAAQDIYLHARGEEQGENVYFNVIKSKGGSINADIIRDGVVEQAVAPGNISITPRKEEANFDVRIKSNDPNVIRDYFDADIDE